VQYALDGPLPFGLIGLHLDEFADKGQCRLRDSDGNVSAAGGAQKSDLFIAATQETWIRIKPGNNPPVQILLKTGRTICRQCDFLIWISVMPGSPDKYKGKSVKIRGKPER